MPSEKIDLCLEQYGLSYDEFLESSEAYDSVVIGACSNVDCDYTCDVEPDCTSGWCEECSTQTVQSILAYMGVI